MKKSIYNKIIFVILLCAFILLCVYIINFKDNKQTYAKISIKEKIWNETGNSKESTKEYEIKKGDVIELNDNWSDKITFKVLKITKNSITIKTSEAMSLNKINLRSKETRFKLNKNELSELYTLTTDAGASYDIVFIE